MTRRRPSGIQGARVVPLDFEAALSAGPIPIMGAAAVSTGITT